MYFSATYRHTRPWLSPLCIWVGQWLARLTPIPVQQILLPAGEIYHLDAGAYRLRVLAGSVWLSEIGIFTAGEQVALTVDAAGLALHSYAQQPAVVAVRG